MARELLRYHSVDDLYEDWLDRITELASSVGALLHHPSRSLARPRLRAMWLTERFRPLHTKMAPSR